MQKESLQLVGGPTVMKIADYCGLEYDAYEEEHRMFTAEKDLNPPCGLVKPALFLLMN